jgi:hypothetical protein
MATDQQTARPQTLICRAGFFDLKIGQFRFQRTRSRSK